MIERKAYARGSDDGDNGKAISPNATGIRNRLSQPSDGPPGFDGHTAS
jgi:hypothetical protein